MNTYQLPDILKKEIEEFESVLQKRIRNEIDETVFKAHRVPFGIYEQRTPETYMIRVRCPSGVVTPSELEAIARIGADYQSTCVHLTTRGELQLHGMKLETIAPVLRELYQAGLSTRGGGGNTVRNISGSWDSGINPEEAFDVQPYAIALTNRLIAENDSWGLPRKYKIAFSSSTADNSLARYSDLGFIASVQNGKKGFYVYGAGGMGGKSSPAILLMDFMPEQGVYAAASAMKQIFHRLGNRKNRHQARIRFIRYKLGDAEFKKLFMEEYESVIKNTSPLEIRPLDYSPVKNFEKASPADPEQFNQWKNLHVSPQKQEGLFSVTLPVKEGDIDTARLLKLARWIKPAGDSVIRVSRYQNFHLINLPEESLPAVFNRLLQDGWISPLQDAASIITVCAGATTCKLGICLSKGLADAAAGKLSSQGIRSGILREIRINISGCPNSCSQHLTADIGLQGQALRHGDNLYPAYTVFLRTESPEIAVFGEKSAEVAARQLPDFIAAYLAGYEKVYRQYQSFYDYNRKAGRQDAGKIADVLRSQIPSIQENALFYQDWGSCEPFSLTKRSAGECSAGVFDFIERDLKLIEEYRKKVTEAPADEPANNLIYYSTRLLMITRGVESGDEKTVAEAFIREFIDTGLADGRYRLLLDEKKAGSLTLNHRAELALALSRDVVALYESMDDSFRFKTAGKEQKTPENETKKELLKDLRGVPCPMNFVKTKIELSKLNTGDILTIYLDDGEPIKNVPGSVRSEGNEVIEESKVAEYWKVVIRKK